MPKHIPADLNECQIAYDITEQRFLFISAGCYAVLGYHPSDFYKNHFLLFDMIAEADRAGVKNKADELNGSRTVEVKYKLAKGAKQVCDKKTLVVDEQTGNKVLLSIITGQPEKLHDALHYKNEVMRREQFLSSLIDSQTNFMIRLNAEGKYTFANKQFYKVFNYKKSELIGKDYFQNVAAGDEEVVRKAFNCSVNQPGKVIKLQRKKFDKSGRIFDTEWEMIAITDDEGKVTEIQAVGQDITDRLIVEREAKAMAGRLDNFIESITDSFFILSADWKFVRVNSAFEKIFQKQRDELTGTLLWTAFPNFINSNAEYYYRRAVTEKQRMRFVEFYKPIGKWFTVTAYPSIEGLTVFLRDITDEKRAQEDAIWTKNSLEALINNTEDQIWSVDTESRYVYMNKAYRASIFEITGYEPKEGDYSFLHNGYDEQTVSRWNGYYNRALTGEPYSIINESLDPVSHQTISFEISFNPIYKTKGDITGVGCFARNITERLKTEHAIVDQNERLRHIASLTSHELRRPVASMLGLINIMDRVNFFNPDNMEIIEHLLTVGNEIDEVIRMIVDKTFMGEASNKYRSPM